MWLMLQQDQPEDFVIASGETHTVREFVERAFAKVGIIVTWKGSGVEEKGFNDATGEVLVNIDPRYFRPTEVDLLLGDPTKAKEKMGWQPTVSFAELVELMVEEDIKAAEKDLLCQKHGFQINTHHE
jgi:GDPmannose 4,6-dehydratase